jgi:hypothetical protein
MKIEIMETKEKLLNSIQHEHAEFANALEVLSIRAASLSEICTGFNGLSSFWKSVQLHLEGIANNAIDESEAFTKKLGGDRKYEIVSVVNPDLVRQIKAARALFE